MNRLAQNKTRCRFGNHVRSLSAAECVMKSWLHSGCDEDPLFQERSERTNEQTNKRTNEQTNKRTNEETKERTEPIAIRYSPIHHSPFAIRPFAHSPIRPRPFAHSPSAVREWTTDLGNLPACCELRAANMHIQYTKHGVWFLKNSPMDHLDDARCTMNDERCTMNDER